MDRLPATAPAQEIPLRLELNRQERDIQRLDQVARRLVDRLEVVTAQRPPNPGMDILKGPAGPTQGASILLNTLAQNRAKLCDLAELIESVLDRLEV